MAVGLRGRTTKLRRFIFLATAIAAILVQRHFARNPSTAAVADEFRQPQEATADIEFNKFVQPLLAKYCYDCHGDGAHLGGLALDNYKTASSIVADGKKWDLVYRYVRTHQMPPSTDDQPTPAERTIIARWVDGQLDSHYAKHPDPGAITIHRLNRVEYDNTIKDLLEIDSHPSADFPADDSGYGFDNIADVLSLPPILMEKYIAAAEKVLDQAIVTDPIQSRVVHVPGPLAEISNYAYGARGDGWVQVDSGQDDYVAFDLKVPQTGEYIFRFQGYGERTGGPAISSAIKQGIASDGPMIACIELDDTVIKRVAVSEDKAHPSVYEARVVAPAGSHRMQVRMHHARGGSNEDIVSNNMIGREQPGVFLVKYVEAEGPLPHHAEMIPDAALHSTNGQRRVGRPGFTLSGAGNVSGEFQLEKESPVTIQVKACASRCGEQPAKLRVLIDGKSPNEFDVLAPAPLAFKKSFPGTIRPICFLGLPQFYEVPMVLPAGKHEVSAEFINPAADPENPNFNLRQRSLTIDSIRLSAADIVPSLPPLSEPVAKIFRKFGVTEQVHSAGTATAALADPKSEPAVKTGREIISDFAWRAWRRPVPADEVDRLMRLYRLAAEQDQNFEECVKLSFKAILVSPNFLYRDLMAHAEQSGQEVQQVDEYSLATRLSYFLWSTTPDDELLTLAGNGQLRKNLNAQIERMLTSPRSDAIVQNFGGQWLQFRSLSASQPAKTFTKFDPALRAAMKKEPEFLFRYVMRENRSIIDFLNADYTFANERLATFYQIPDVSGDEFRKVSLAGTPRRGVLTEAGILMLTSNPTRTSPVKRGKWVLDRILGAPPAPPPPDVGTLDDPKRQLSGSLRQMMEQHRSDPNCMSCHALMDPIGFAFENFDAIGDFRTTDSENNGKIETAGQLATGESFIDSSELIKALSARQDDFVSCFSEQLLTYALGRGVEYYDRAAIDEVVGKVKANDNRFSAVIQAIIESVPFQMERTSRSQASAEKPL